MKHVYLAFVSTLQLPAKPKYLAMLIVLWIAASLLGHLGMSPLANVTWCLPTWPGTGNLYFKTIIYWNGNFDKSHFCFRFVVVSPSATGRPCPSKLSQNKPCPSDPCYKWNKTPWSECQLQVYQEGRLNLWFILTVTFRELLAVPGWWRETSAVLLNHPIKMWMKGFATKTSPKMLSLSWWKRKSQIWQPPPPAMSAVTMTALYRNGRSGRNASMKNVPHKLQVSIFDDIWVFSHNLFFFTFSFSVGVRKRTRRIVQSARVPHGKCSPHLLETGLD